MAVGEPNPSALIWDVPSLVLPRKTTPDASKASKKKRGGEHENRPRTSAGLLA